MRSYLRWSIVLTLIVALIAVGVLGCSSEEEGTPTPTGAPTKEPPATSAATATSPPDVVLEQTQTPTPLLPLTNGVSSEDTPGNAGVGIITLVVLGVVVVAVGLIVLLSRRVRG